MAEVDVDALYDVDAPTLAEAASPWKKYFSTARPATEIALKTSNMKAANVVEEVIEVNLPAGFFDTKQTSENNRHPRNSPLASGSGKTQEDALSKLAKLLAEAGGEDKAGILKFTPSKNSAWKNRVRQLPKWEPPYEPLDVSDESSTESVMFPLPDEMDPQAAISARRRRERRDKIKSAPKSLAREVYGDMRYFEEAAKKGKLVSYEYWGEIGEWGMNKFRDYRLYPADFHVAEIVGLDSSKKAENTNAEDAVELDENDDSLEEEQVTSFGRKRKRVQRLADEQRLLNPRKRGPGRPRKPAAGRTRLGDKYQASVPARPFSDFDKSNSSSDPG